MIKYTNILNRKTINHLHQMTNQDLRQLYRLDDPNEIKLLVKLPMTSDFNQSRVAIVYNRLNLIKFSTASNNLLLFIIPDAKTNTILDKVKIRTHSGKEYTYDRVKVNSILDHKPIVTADLINLSL